MANLLNAATAANPMVAPAIKTFLARYTTGSHDPIVLQRQLTIFDVINPAVPRVTPSDVRGRLFSLTNEYKPCALLVLEEDPIHATGIVKIYHAPAQCPHLIDSATHAFMGRNFVANGELFNKETANYELPDATTVLANQGIAVQCYNPVALDQALIADPALSICGPFALGDPDTVPVIVRNSCLLPARFAARFLSSNLTPREAWEQIGGAIRADDEAVVTACEPIVHWLQYALHKNSAVNVASPCIIPALAAQVGMPLREHRCRINMGYLPALDETAIITREAELIAAKIGSVRDQLQLQLEESRKVAAAAVKVAKTPGTKWPERIQNILNIAQVDTEEELPPMWHRLANARDRDTRVLLEGILAKACQELPGVSSRMKTLVEPALASTLLSADWRMINPDQLDSGVTPWVVGQASSEAAIRASTQNMMYDHATNGGAQLTLSDITSLTKLMIKDKVPVVHSDALRMVKQFYVCYGAAFGGEHSLVKELAMFIEEYQQAVEESLGEMDYIPQLPRYSKSMVPCLVVRHVQVHVANWLDKQWNTDVPLAPPNLSALFEKMRLRIQWEIPMPAKYEESLLGTPNGGGNDRQRVLPGPAAGRSEVPPGGPTVPPAASTTVYNNNYNAAFEVYREKRDAAGKRIKAKVARANAGNVTPDDMCPAFHISGQCNVGCTRVADHRTHTTEQDAKLATWAEEHWHE
jgi:hypothetical protein